MKKLARIVAVFAAFTMMFGIASCNTNADEPKKPEIKKNIIGTKTKPNAVGDIVFTDGSATPYTDLTDSQKAAAIAVIFYAGSTTDTLGAKVLGVGLQNTQGESEKELIWSSKSADGFWTSFESTICTPIEPDYAYAGQVTFTGKTDGYDNWDKFCETVSDKDKSGNYPVWAWVNAYPKTDSLSGDWYLPSVAELAMMYLVKGTVNAALEKVDGTKIADDEFSAYWTSSQSEFYSNDIWNVWFSTGFLSPYSKEYTFSVCCIRAFD